MITDPNLNLAQMLEDRVVKIRPDQNDNTILRSYGTEITDPEVLGLILYKGIYEQITKPSKRNSHVSRVLMSDAFKVYQYCINSAN